MGKYSADESIEAAVVEAESAYHAAIEAFAAAPDDPDAEAAYRQAKNDFATARQTARAGRGMSIITE